jgi:hypothetical protein
LNSPIIKKHAASLEKSETIRREDGLLVLDDVENVNK